MSKDSNVSNLSRHHCAWIVNGAVVERALNNILIIAADGEINRDLNVNLWHYDRWAGGETIAGTNNNLRRIDITTGLDKGRNDVLVKKCKQENDEYQKAHTETKQN